MSFSNIYGHSRQIGMLQKAMSQGRLGQSYIFSGLAAIGKKTLALEFARAMNCEKLSTLHDSCGLCPSCRKMISGNHPDMHIIETQSQFIRIDAIRAIQEQMTFKPLEGGKRIFIINDADKMNEQAANALLKTLEEPSIDNFLILITARPYWLPQTILSRCRQLRFTPLSAETVARFLVEKMEIDKTQASLLANLSGGSIGEALDLKTEEMIVFRSELGRQLEDGASDPMNRLMLASFLGQDKEEIRQGLHILKTFFRDAIAYKETASDAMVINADQLPLVAALAARLSGQQLLSNIALAEKSSETIEMNVNKSLTLEAMAFKLHL
jgi:DNA polymerase-3 subunit delta'